VRCRRRRWCRRRYDDVQGYLLLAGLSEYRFGDCSAALENGGGGSLRQGGPVSPILDCRIGGRRSTAPARATGGPHLFVGVRCCCCCSGGSFTHHGPSRSRRSAPELVFALPAPAAAGCSWPHVSGHVYSDDAGRCRDSGRSPVGRSASSAQAPGFVNVTWSAAHCSPDPQGHERSHRSPALGGQRATRPGRRCSGPEPLRQRIRRHHRQSHRHHFQLAQSR